MRKASDRKDENAFKAINEQKKGPKSTAKTQLINSLRELTENVLGTEQEESSMQREHQTAESATL